MMNEKSPKVDGLIRKEKRWRAEFEKLREIILSCGLMEEVKWMQACYTFEGSNIVLIHGFKEYCALLFFKGVLLKDPKKILIQQTENVQAGRQIRFTNLAEITAREAAIRAYIREAIEVEKKGLKVPHKTTEDFKAPEEFQKALNSDAALKRAFENLTPGRQRGYLLYFASAKQAKTREARIEKYTPHILDGKGVDDE
jgi:uncharacterized protein YdeI (YjbR/CyaY-like superfamily)